MNEIEKMYENCGIEIPTARLKDDNGEIFTRPSFTPEKQLEIVKFLLNHSNYWFHISDDCYTYYYSNLEITLANIINEVWQDLADQEKEEIRRILND